MLWNPGTLAQWENVGPRTPPWFYILRPNVHGLMFDFMIATGLQGDCGLRLEVLKASLPLAPDWVSPGSICTLVLYSLAVCSRICMGFRNCF